MSWFLLAILGHLANAVAFIIDKTLLNKAWKHSATYASLVGILSALALILVPWVKAWPQNGLFWISCLSGGIFVFAVWTFFEALRRGEASRVVPIIGSLIPVFTLVGTTIFLDERINVKIGIGFTCLLIATWFLAHGRKKSRLDKLTILIAAVCASLFALTSVLGKYTYAHTDFLGVVIVSRLSGALTGLFIGIGVSGARQELRKLFSSSKSQAHTSSFGLTFIGQALGAVGFLLINAALNQGSAALVNALQAVQYALIVIVAWIGGKFFHTVLNEDLSKKTLLTKGGAIGLVGIGLWLLAG